MRRRLEQVANYQCSVWLHLQNQTPPGKVPCGYAFKKRSIDSSPNCCCLIPNVDAPWDAAALAADAAAAPLEAAAAADDAAACSSFSPADTETGIV